MKITTITTLKKITHSRIAVLTAALATVVVATSATFAYGPERPTYTIAHPADHITFDSITDNPNYGDERNFTIVKDASNAAAGGWTDNMTVQDGKEYLVRIYVHNNAASNLNLVAKNTRVSASVPTDTANSLQIDGYITADNASPQKIWDSVVLSSDKKFNVAYVMGSAEYENNYISGPISLPDSIVTSTGAKVGYKSMDGDVPGCYEYSGIATFKVKVSMPSPDFTVEKKVRLSGTTDWQKSITAQPGQKVDYQIGYENTGSTVQSNVIAQDKLPAGVHYITGSTTVKNADNAQGNGLAITNDNLIGADGLNFGSYDTESNALIRFSATLPSNDELAICGPNNLVNTATVATQNGEKSDTATVTVTKTNCTPTATALPTTGPVEIIAGLVGIAAMTVGIVYYVKSRRDLEQALHNAQTHPTLTKLDDVKPVEPFESTDKK